MHKKLKKILTILFLILMLNITTMPYLNAQKTQDELDEEISGIEEDKSATEDDLTESKQSYEELLSQTQEIQNEIKTTKEQIQTAESEITTLNDTIDELDDEITEKETEAEQVKGDADSSLIVLQQMSNQNFTVEAIFGGGSSIGDVFNRAESAQVLTSSITTSLDELITVLTEIKTLQSENKANRETLITTKETLEESKETLESQKEENNTLLTQLNASIDESEDSIEEYQATIEDLQAQKDALADVGCTGDDVYGVDCAVPSSGGNAPPIATSGFTRPVATGVITNPYGYDGYDITAGGFHPALDIANSCGTPIYASAPGTVIVSNWTGSAYGGTGYGNYIAIAHYVNGANYVTLYGHMSALYVSVGQTVTYNTQLGQMGTSGSSTGCHVHFGINYGSQLASYAQIPYGFVDPRTMVSMPATGVWFYSRY